MRWFLVASLVYGIEYDFTLLPWNERIGKYTNGITELGEWNPYDHHVLRQTDKEKESIEDNFGIDVNSTECSNFTRGSYQGQACFTVKSKDYLWFGAHDMTAPTPCSLENGCPVTADCDIALRWRHVSKALPDFEWEKLVKVNSSALFTVDERANIKCDQEFNVSVDGTIIVWFKALYLLVGGEITLTTRQSNSLVTIRFNSSYWIPVKSNGYADGIYGYEKFILK